MPDDSQIPLASMLPQPPQPPPGSLGRMLTLQDYANAQPPGYGPAPSGRNTGSLADYLSGLNQDYLAGPINAHLTRLSTQYSQPDPFTQDMVARLQGQPGTLTPDQRSASLRDQMMSIIGSVGGGGAEGPSYKPFTGTGSKMLNSIRDAHLAQSDPLPLTGATAPVTPPPHIKTLDDFNGLVSRYADLAQEGAVAKDWYNDSGNAVLSHVGDNPQAADAFAYGLARTSPSTDVASNSLFAVKAHNQGVLGDPIQSGRFPNAMGQSIEKHYYGGEPISGEKIGPFMGGIAEQWNPNFSHQYVNDGWNMTALEYPRENEGAMWSGTPTAGQHNFARIVADRATQELAQRTGVPWSPKQAQAASWTAIKARTEGTPINAAGFNFANGLQKSYGQISYEAAPGLTTNHLPEYHDAAPEVKQEFHDAINGVLTDEQGRDIISRQLGMLTGPTIHGPGVFEGKINPGSQAQVALGQAQGGALAGVDPASRALIDTSSAVRGALLRQDAAAWHKPSFVSNLKPAQTNMIDARVGRPLTDDEALSVTKALKDASGSDFFSPISTKNGFRVMNVPEVSGVQNAKLHDIVNTALSRVDMPGVASVSTHPAFADGNYVANDWRENPNGEGYQGVTAATGRPNLQRAAHDLFTTLGPRIAQVEDDFAQRYGWTPNRATRFWEQLTPPTAQPVGRQPHWQGALPPLASMLRGGAGQ